MKRIFFAVLLLAAPPAFAAPNGAKIFQDQCEFCHQAGGVGVPGQFPRLAGRAGVIASSPEGRDFLITLLLNGMSGHITADGQDILGLMPSFATMADGDVAAVLTYVSRLGKGKAAAFTAKDVADKRGGPSLDPGAVAVQRANLVTEKIVPP